MRALALSLVLAASAHAATIPVTSPTDEADANGLCSLREAIQAATTDTAVDACPAGEPGMDRIEVDPALGTLTLALGEIEIDGDVEIAWSGSGGFGIDAEDTGRVFVVRGGTVRLEGLGLTNGWATRGGAILVESGATLEMEDVSIRNSRAIEEGGCIAVDGGTLSITDGSFGGCTASIHGGVLALNNATTTLIDVSGGGSVGTSGGFAYVVGGTLVADDLEVESGEAGAAGGALFLSDTEATITSSRLADNDAVAGGAIAAQRSTVTLRFVHMEYNDAADVGGAIAAFPGTTLVIERSEIDENVAEHGAGLFLDGATTTLDRVLLDINEGSGEGGGIYARGGSLAVTDSNILFNYARLGAGLYLLTDATLSGTTIQNNKTETDIGSQRGGGIYVDGGTLAMTNSTLSDNQTLRAFDGGTDSDGGGLHVRTGTVRLEGVTIVGNSAERDGGGISREGGTLEIKNSILGGNTANRDGADCLGEVVSLDHNLFQSTDDCTITGSTDHTLFGVDPELGPLTNNGGLTATYLPLEGSPAVDAGATDLVFDQRGYPRDATPDIGAVERGAQPPLSTETDPDATLAIRLAPNPVRTTTSVLVRARGEATLALYDARGRLVATLYEGHVPDALTVEADVRDLAPGVYLLRLGTPAGMVSRPVVVTR